MILTREQLETLAPRIAVPGIDNSLIDTSFAYHDLRDAILALVHEFEGDNIIGAAYVTEQFRGALDPPDWGDYYEQWDTDGGAWE